MKKILFLVIGILFYLAGSCQTFSHTASNPTGTITNTGSDTMTFSTSKAYGIVGIQPVITKASGTMAGTAVLYGSLDGVNYGPVGDTLTLSNTTVNTAVWNLPNPPYVYYRIVTGGATTVSATTSAKFVGRKP